MHAVIIFVLQGCLASSDLQAAFGILQCTPSISFINFINRLGFSFLNEIMPTTSFKPFINQIQQRIYDQNLQDQNSKIRECEKLSFLRNIYDENERANGLKDVVGIISFKKENPNLLMHEIIFLIHTFDF
jgi:hypothetical protein